jgi:transcriptional repressor NrdR
MRCPHCGARGTKVIDKRDSKPDSADIAVRRRRECTRCGARFRTYERPDIGRLRVVKMDGRREDFSRAKLVAGLMKACTKRPIDTGTLEQLAAAVEAEARQGETLEVPTAVIGELIMAHLRALDKVAYIRFASVYRNFADISSFEDEIRMLLPPPTSAESDKREALHAQAY